VESDNFGAVVAPLAMLPVQCTLDFGRRLSSARAAQWDWDCRATIDAGVTAQDLRLL
jgi:hypothetical protein